MKKHLSIQVDFSSSVRLTPSERKKIQKWLDLACLSLNQQFQSSKILHPSWLKGTVQIKIGLLLCGDKKIRELNREHRDKDKVTDVLSFPFQDNLRTPKSIPSLPELYLGDLAICHNRTKSQAKEFKITYWDEFIHLFFHGTIHLMGYDHEVSPKEEAIMQKWENELLEKFSKNKVRSSSS